MRLEGNSSAQECPGEGFHPLVLVNLTQLDDSSPKGFLEVLMLTFHRAVGLLVVCWREENLDVEGLHDVLVGHEGVAVVGHGHHSVSDSR